MQQSRTVHAVSASENAEFRHLPLVDLLIDTRAELTELVVRSGLKVLEAMLEEDRTAVCGPRYAHQDDRAAVRAGTTASTVVLGGRKVEIRTTSAVIAGACPMMFGPGADFGHTCMRWVLKLTGGLPT